MGYVVSSSGPYPSWWICKNRVQIWWRWTVIILERKLISTIACIIGEEWSETSACIISHQGGPTINSGFFVLTSTLKNSAQIKVEPWALTGSLQCIRTCYWGWRGGWRSFPTVARRHRAWCPAVGSSYTGALALSLALYLFKHKLAVHQ